MGKILWESTKYLTSNKHQKVSTITNFSNNIHHKLPTLTHVSYITNLLYNKHQKIPTITNFSYNKIFFSIFFAHFLVVYNYIYIHRLLREY